MQGDIRNARNQDRKLIQCSLIRYICNHPKETRVNVPPPQRFALALERDHPTSSRHDSSTHETYHHRSAPPVNLFHHELLGVVSINMDEFRRLSRRPSLPSEPGRRSLSLSLSLPLSRSLSRYLSRSLSRSRSSRRFLRRRSSSYSSGVMPAASAYLAWRLARRASRRASSSSSSTTSAGGGGTSATLSGGGGASECSLTQDDVPECGQEPPVFSRDALG